ncbi:MAG: hypothetical protein ACXWUG_04200 [Polyangiales bacterium]
MQKLSLVPPVLAAIAVGCSAEIPQFDDDPKPEVCGGAVCFPPDHVAVRRWGDGEISLAAWNGTGDSCLLPRSGKQPIPGHAVVIELTKPRPGSKLTVVPHDKQMDPGVSFARVRAVRVDPDTGRALADEEGVAGEATVLDLDENTGSVRVKIRARWSSGVTSETIVDVAGWPRCVPPVDDEAA